MFLPPPTDPKPAGAPVPKTRAPSLIAEALRALAERNRAMGLSVQGASSVARAQPASTAPRSRSFSAPSITGSYGVPRYPLPASRSPAGAR
jgi:hypothetical protein